MEEFFDREGPWGRQMMCGTASVQVCVDAGDDSAGQSGYRSRWRLLHAIGPVLVAAFANSPLRDGKPTGWRSARQQVWANMDPGRTRAPVLHGEGGRGPARRVDRLRAGRRAHVRPRARVAGLDRAGRGDLPRLAARRRLRDRCGRPTAEDLDYHLSTLFPPVRPHGHMELRMIDAQPGDGWIVPAAVVTALADDDRAADAALAAAEPVWDGSAGRRGSVAAGGAAAARPTRRSARPASSASRRPAPRWPGWARPPRSAGRSPTSPSVTCRKTDVLPTINWTESDDDGGTTRPGNPARGHRAGTDRRPATDLAADRQRGRGRPGQTALAADVPAGLGPRAHRQPGRALAAARGRRPRADAPGDRSAL